jgi:hypothetical protein
VELSVLLVGSLLTVWLGPWMVALPGFVPAAQLVFCAVFAYVAYVSPVWLHRDSLAERGLGNWRTLFIRTDNLPSAAWRFGVLAVAGSVAILLLAAVWNPGWLARANWKAWAMRLFFYSLSTSVQAVAFLGWGLVRLKRILVRVSPGAPADDARRGELLVAAAAAVIFGGLHAPEAAAMALTAAFGFAVAWISLRTPNVFAAAGCQTVLGLLVHRVLELSLQLGAFHYHPDIHPVRRIVPFADRLIGNLY